MHSHGPDMRNGDQDDMNISRFYISLTGLHIAVTCCCCYALAELAQTIDDTTQHNTTQHNTAQHSTAQDNDRVTHPSDNIGRDHADVVEELRSCSMTARGALALRTFVHHSPLHLDGGACCDMSKREWCGGVVGSTH